MSDRKQNNTGLAVALALLAAVPAAQAVQVQDLVRLKGSESSQLVGMGLVVGLSGTGDGGKNLPAMRSLAAVMQKLLDPNVVAAELKDANNVAVVALSVTIPDTGVREGDHLDVHVTAPAAKSLVGGRLFLVPMIGPMPDSPVFAFASGPVTVDNLKTPAAGVVKADKGSGAQLTRDVMTRLLDEKGRITLVINDDNASWPMATNLASLVNGVLAPDGPAIAKAIDQKNVIVEVPAAERGDPSAFVSQILQSYIDPSLISGSAKVVVNAKTGTIVVTGDVQISPVIISHKGLTITTITPEPKPTLQNPQTDTTHVVALDPGKRGGAKLADLLNAFKQLKVDTADQIAILRLIHKTGKLHAQLIEE